MRIDVYVYLIFVCTHIATSRFCGEHPTNSLYASILAYSMRHAPYASALTWSAEPFDNPTDAAVPASAPYTMLFLQQVSSTLNCPGNRSRVQCPGWLPG